MNLQIKNTQIELGLLHYKCCVLREYDFATK